MPISAGASKTDAITSSSCTRHPVIGKVRLHRSRSQRFVDPAESCRRRTTSKARPGSVLNLCLWAEFLAMLRFERALQVEFELLSATEDPTEEGGFVIPTDVKRCWK